MPAINLFSLTIDYFMLIYRKCMCHGFFMNTAELQGDGQYVTVSSVHFRLFR